MFGAPERNPWASVVGRVLVVEGHMPPPAAESPGIFALRDPTRIRELLSRAGFGPPEMADIALTWSFPSPDAHWRFLTELAGAISPILRASVPRRRRGSERGSGRWLSRSGPARGTRFPRCA